MKKILMPFVLLIASGILLPSCNSSSSLTITKRHYRSGYYVNRAGKGSISHTTTAVANKSVKPVAEPTEVIETKQVNYVASAPMAIANVKLSVVHPKAIAYKNVLPVNNNSSLDQNTTIQNSSVVDGVQEVSSHDKNVEVAFALVLVCAILIPPLGVGLMYGLDDYFWIDLILTLLFYIPGLIFALIVILS